MNSSTIDTYTGKLIDIIAPDPQSICIEDIAWGLGNSCRFNGHCRAFYSVAQHCVLGTYLADGVRIKLLFLIHDAAETYLGDISKPVKSQLPGFEILEEKMMAVIYNALAVEAPTIDEREAIKTIDTVMLATEKKHLRPNVSRDWQLPESPTVDPRVIDGLEHLWDANYSANEFIECFEKLRQCIQQGGSSEPLTRPAGL